MQSCYFSVIVPVYDICEEYLKQCLESVLAQKMSDFEIIMIDDGSNAECAALCDAFAERDTRIIVIHQENRGVSEARNSGIEIAHGKWTLFLDADDWIDADAFEKLKLHLDDTVCEMVLFDQLNEWNDQSTPLRYPIEENTIYSLDDADNKERFALLVNRSETLSDGTASATLCMGWNMVFRTDWMHAHDLRFSREVRIAEDTLFMYDAITQMHAFTYVKGICYHYRMNDVGVTRRYKDWIDADSANLLRIIVPALHRLNADIAAMKNDSFYHVLDDECLRFKIEQALFLLVKKYYDPAYPSPKTRKRDALRFFKGNPGFAFIYRRAPSGTSMKLRIKLMILRFGLYDVYCAIAAKRRKRVQR